MLTRWTLCRRPSIPGLPMASMARCYQSCPSPAVRPRVLIAVWSARRKLEMHCTQSAATRQRSIHTRPLACIGRQAPLSMGSRTGGFSGLSTAS